MENKLASPNHKATRTLAAILCTGAANLNTRLSTTEASAISALRRDFQMMRDVCKQYNGHVLKSVGERLLMSFSSAVNAVTCSLKIQAELAQLESKPGFDQPLQHRIGIHLGDVFISDAEIIGSGVTIAMQLQTEAPPGGICISQPLYEVIRWNISPNVIYLGERSVEGVAKAVPIYQIYPVAAAPITDSADDSGITPSPQPPQSLIPTSPPNDDQTSRYRPPQQLLDEVAWALEWSETSRRVKKVILYACSHSWETDATKLDHLELSGLLSDLLQVAPTFEVLQTLLHRIVGRLNKRSEYLPTLKTIFRHVERLYKQEGHSNPNIYCEIAHRIEHSNQARRIKKLILWTCREQWEKDPIALDQIPLGEIIPELVGVASNVSQLRALLNKGVQSLNKPVEYEQVASLIMDYLQPLYAHDAPSRQVTSPDANSSPLDWQPLSNQKEPVALQPESAVPVPVLPDVPSSGSLATVQSKDSSVSESNHYARAEDACNVFDLRVNLMKRTNSLRAKLLIFSVVQHVITSSDRSWLLLGQHRLDDLLSQLLKTCTTCAELEIKLGEAAAAQNSPDEYAQVAETLIRVLQPCYAQF
jgi:adenylate cyclase